MKKVENIFLGKKILIYGLGKTGISAYKFLKNKAKVYLFDDKIRNNLKISKKILRLKELSNISFDKIIISPGIDILNCKLTNLLNKNSLKIYTDLDVFYSFYKNESIAITGTNGKSTTAKILHNVLRDQNRDVRLVGNIGNPILSEKKVKKKTVFVIEASSYQLDYSKLFSAKYAMILNISADHLERHRNLKNYVDAKLKLLYSQKKRSIAYVKKNDVLISKNIKSKKLKCKVIEVGTKINDNFLKKIDNNYFSSETNKENLSFVLKISKKLRLKKNILLKTIQRFKGLNYRQQIIFKNDKLTIINDSKSTSFASTSSFFKTKSNIFWLIGGIHKKGDKLLLKKRDFKNVQAFIFGKNQNFFIKELKNKIRFHNFINLSEALKDIFKLIRKKKLVNQIILFSPCAASFDSFKNFEDRGSYFNKLIMKYLNEI